MISGRITGLSLIILGLSGMIAFEVVDRHTQPADFHPTPTRLPSPATRSRATPSQANVDARLSEILARPVFSPDRKPVSLGTKSVTGLPRLTGIVVTGSRKIAIFAAPSGGPPVVAEEGSHLNAYEVKSISDTGVTIIGPAGTTVMTPIFDAAPSSGVKRPLQALAEPGRAQKK